MTIDNFDVIGVTTLEPKANAPLIIDGNTVLPFSVAVRPLSATELGSELIRMFDSESLYVVLLSSRPYNHMPVIQFLMKTACQLLPTASQDAAGFNPMIFIANIRGIDAFSLTKPASRAGGVFL